MKNHSDDVQTYLISFAITKIAWVLISSPPPPHLQSWPLTYHHVWYSVWLTCLLSIRRRAVFTNPNAPLPIDWRVSYISSYAPRPGDWLAWLGSLGVEVCWACTEAGMTRPGRSTEEDTADCGVDCLAVTSCCQSTLRHYKCERSICLNVFYSIVLYNLFKCWILFYFIV